MRESSKERSGVRLDSNLCTKSEPGSAKKTFPSESAATATGASSFPGPSPLSPHAFRNSNGGSCKGIVAGSVVFADDKARNAVSKIIHKLARVQMGRAQNVKSRNRPIPPGESYHVHLERFSTRQGTNGGTRGATFHQGRAEKESCFEAARFRPRKYFVQFEIGPNACEYGNKLATQPCEQEVRTVPSLHERCASQGPNESGIQTRGDSKACRGHK